jgi:EAL domain-containing protein (putative c-di-GMP-specific phosphodiesterase class I)
LKIKAVAEGVETKEHLTFLEQKKCHLAQGYYFSPPLTAKEFENLLENSPGLPVITKQKS